MKPNGESTTKIIMSLREEKNNSKASLKFWLSRKIEILKTLLKPIIIVKIPVKKVMLNTGILGLRVHVANSQDGLGRTFSNSWD
jgi:hypothetical protein